MKTNYQTKWAKRGVSEAADAIKQAFPLLSDYQVEQYLISMRAFNDHEGVKF